HPPLVGGTDASPSGKCPTEGSGTKRRSRAETRGRVASRRHTTGKEHRALGYRLSRGVGHTPATAPTNAGPTQTGAGGRVGITISGDGGGGRSEVLTAG